MFELSLSFPLAILSNLVMAGYGVSLLKYLAEAQPDSVAKLSYQYRMNSEIWQLSNDIIYAGLLK